MSAAGNLISHRLLQLDAQIDQLETAVLRDETSLQRDKIEIQETFAARTRKVKSERERLNNLIRERELLAATGG